MFWTSSLNWLIRMSAMNELQASSLNDRIKHLQALAHEEPRLDGVLLYGSWTMGEADRYSDLEAYLYVHDDHVDSFDGQAFVEQLAPVSLAVHQHVRHPRGHL